MSEKNRIEAALAAYAAELSSAAERTNRAEDRSAYERHLASVARMFVALGAGELEALQRLVHGERRAIGWGYLGGDEGARAEAAFDRFARFVEAKAPTAPACVPELEGFDCVDHDPIEGWAPEGGEAVLYWLVLHIGVPGEAGADLFTVAVANHAGLHEPEWKERADRSKSPIVVDPYSWQGVMDEVDRCLQRAAGWDWATVWAKLRERFAWEYEGMG